MVSFSTALAIWAITRRGTGGNAGRRLQSETEEIVLNPLIFVFAGLIDLAIVWVIAWTMGG